MKKRYVPLFEEYSQDEENNGVRTYIDFDKQNERSRELNKPKGNDEDEDVKEIERLIADADEDTKAKIMELLKNKQ